MPMWFTEDPWAPIVVCGIVALLLFGLWRADSRTLYLKAMAGVAMLAVVIYLAEKVIVTEPERIEAIVHDIVHAFEEKDVGRTLSHFSESAANERALVALAIHMVDIEDNVRITDMAVKVSDEGTRATSSFRANADASFQGHRDRARTRWEFSFHKEGDDWKVSRIQRLHLIKDEYLEPLDASDF